jgi:polar amino acid transport system permease protein
MTGLLNLVVENRIALFKGAMLTIQLSLISLVVGTVLGLLLALGRISKNVILDKLCWLYIWFFRGTPLLMQIFMIAYALPILLGNYGYTLDIPPFATACIAFSLNSAAYMAEIIRAAIQSIDKGQMEASKALGMSYTQAMRRVIVPQSYRRLIPPVGNEFIMLLKDTALVASIAMNDLLRATSIISSREASAAIYVPTAIIYLSLTTIFTYVFEKLEKKYSVYE